MKSGVRKTTSLERSTMQCYSREEGDDNDQEGRDTGNKQKGENNEEKGKVGLRCTQRRGLGAVKVKVWKY